MDRRTFLMASGGLLLSQFATGCSGQAQTTLRVELLKNTIPAQVLGQFRQQLRQSFVGSFKLNFEPIAQLGDIFDRLQAWKRQESVAQQPKKPLIPLPFLQQSRSVTSPDLVTLGDYWLQTAIDQKLIQPLDVTQLTGWQALPSSPIDWKKLVTRNDQGQIDPKGKVWAAPYRWGSTVIVYRRDLLEQEGLQPPTDWVDLWRPEFRDRLSLLDHPREVIGLVLKKLGYSYNKDLSKVQNLEQELKALHQQVKFYSSTAYLQPLLLGHTWVAVGWSNDVIPLLQRNYKLASVVPQSGTAVWADLWVRPTRAAASPTQSEQRSLPAQWIDFCWQPDVVKRLALLSDAASPMLVGKSLGEQQRIEQVLLPDPKILQQSEFLQPLTDQEIEQYRSLWLSIRQLTTG
jgi:putative spermidine/putrescine transport system substrate-binding protein